MKLTLEEIIEATAAKILKNEGIKVSDEFTFSTDTRTIKPGEIYLPLKGENFDGEAFIDKALVAGAIGFFKAKGKEQKAKSKMENRKWKMENSASCSNSSHLSLLPSDFSLVLQVEDTLIAYFQLANFYRRKINPKTISITGSNGKTTTKEMVYCVMAEKFRTHKSELNFNNEVGLCKTISEMRENTQVLIVEMGMRGLGEIELLSKYAEPDIAIITNVGTAHIGRLGSRENIAKAKCEILKSLSKDGVLIAHDDELIKHEIGNREQETEEAKGKGQKAKSDVILEEEQEMEEILQSSHFFSLNNVKIIEHKTGYSRFKYKGYEYELNIEGDYNIQNALAAIEAGLQMGMTPEEIKKGLKKYSPIEKRWEIQEIKGFKFINDSYNANPDSMLAAISTVLGVYEPPILFVLGDMGELGEEELEFHSQIGDFLLKNIKKDIGVITVGKLANEITKKLNKNGIFSKNFADNSETSRYILENVQIGTTIVLKASRSMKFEEIIQNVKCET
ncbi:MAG: UDP-N-acetylmuramoyl-tripeptide--D-alanyl-D-alanine ligase [Candidatus Gastranaerophilales bacterium]|nr:UDP-N-acetylmuramoyl-tripeptide--D-alanyl-D-alanine ligase [Candidatus Gastranaerophilales bacterium]